MGIIYIWLYRAMIICVCVLLLVGHKAMASDDGGSKNASNPLAKVTNTDLRWQYMDDGSGRVNDLFIDGAFMATDTLKVKYELHYWETDISGSSETDWESVSLKGIYFPKDGAWGDVNYRLALGLEWIVDLGDPDKGIGSGSDQLSPFGGIALGFKSKTMIIPLVQQFWSYSGEDANTTAFRVIALQPLPEPMWLKLDAKAPVDWENDRAVPATAES